MSDDDHDQVRETLLQAAEVHRLRAEASELIALPLNVPASARLAALFEGVDPEYVRAALGRLRRPRRHLALVTDPGEAQGQSPSQASASLRSNPPGAPA